MTRLFTRMGDGSALWLTEGELRADLEAGMKDASIRGKIPSLTDEEMNSLYEIVAAPNKIVSVERGNEVVHSFDAGTLKFGIRGGVPVDRLATVMAHERAMCSDTMELSHLDYSFKPVKAIAHEERQMMEQIQLNATIPVLYGAMPNVGLYTKPDGPIDNWAELLPLAKIKEAQAAQEEAMEHAIKDMVYVSSIMYEGGADGINFDSVGASGDADFLATLRAIEILKEKFPEMEIEVGMAGEFILGMHGELKYDGTRLAGLYPHQQVKIVEKAGATIFGPVINTNSSKSFPWNLARAVTYVKACAEAASIPIHPNAGMGVGGIPLTNTCPMDCMSRASKALVEIGKADGL
ncbi:MAG: [dimethylamine--corrinoid protein] Co-methyltransferase [Desulfitobacterium hafniense]|nr:[dimethylamine--corrinoid protein] Co-methyltransferase [Desulfitobacterium hafniense]